MVGSDAGRGALDRELEAFESVAADLAPEQLSMASLCPGRSVGDVVAHVVDGVDPLAWWRRGASVRAVHVAVHSLDVAVPCGRAVALEPVRLTWLLSTAARLGRPFGVKRRVAGLWLEAVDVGWTHGTLPDGNARDRHVRDVMVSGPGDALLLAMFGRTVWLDRLAGHGVETLGARA